MWIEETGDDGVTPVMIGENVAKTQISVLYVEKTQKVEKIAVHSKVTTEMLADLPQLTSYIQNAMLKRVSVVIENQLFSGTGTTPQIKGATQWAAAFSAGSLANTIPSANEIDVIHAVANQVGLAFGTPNAIFVHPDTLNKIFGLKSSTGEPLYKEYMDWSIGGMGRNLVIAGMNVFATPAVTAGSYVGGDMKVLNVLFRENLNIRLTPSGDDPINNLMTLIVEARLVQFASANDISNLIQGDFATAIAALTSIA
jgi:HK97 family phage major capsid protein